ESKERVRSAIRNSGYPFPVKRITINLAPADYKKEGSYYDLPIALGILSCMGLIEQDLLNSCLVVGELSLDGNIRQVKGILPIVCAAKANHMKECLLPIKNAPEGALVEGINIIGLASLQEAILHLNGEALSPPFTDKVNKQSESPTNQLDFHDVKGQENVKRALEIAAAGHHNLIMIGGPGSGKTMMAHRLPTILPDLSLENSIEVTKIYSICGKLNQNSHVINTRPFRAPHHTTTPAALIGGGRVPKPGEISLAHHGVLFLDEFLEFNKHSLETLRQPLESNTVTISRVNGSYTFPANFMLVASTNPCPCGFYPDDSKCHCSSHSIKQYRHKLSGPLLDRIDIHIETPLIPYEKLISNDGEYSKDIKARVSAAAKIQEKRYENDSIMYNSQLSPGLIEKYCALGHEEISVLKKAFLELDLSIRSYHKIIKLARTIADLDESANINLIHLYEAIQYRGLDRQCY
ncbi:MAG TPA: YifB family Mg chelatase-like AAA ATPase, partial [Epulopiscium sp.]|nr:YifB family Mg chelatase-like AAA ATPase [Candidatus Epulonipiscium sp.]